MTTEEKAKRYDEAIERANELNYVSDKDSLQCKTVEHIFPELKEDKGENIREEIITYLSTVEDKELIPYESWIAWLEKQGEQKYDPCEDCEEVMLNCPNFSCIKKRAFKQGKTVLEAIKEEKVDNTNKVEPKFHEQK